jgi:hypothetical protein
MLRVAERRNSPLRRPRNALPRDEQHPHHNQPQVGQHRGANRMHDLAPIRPAAHLGDHDERSICIREHDSAPPN